MKMKVFSTIKNTFSWTSGPVEDLNLYNIFKPFYFVLSLFGMFPYSLNYNKSKHVFTIIKKSIYVNAMCAVSTFATIFIFFVAHELDLIRHWQKSNMTDGNMSAINYGFELAAINIVCFTVFIWAFLNRLKYVTILNALAGLLFLVTNEKRRSVLDSLRFQINVIVMGGLGFLVILQICVNFTRSDSLWKTVLVALTFNLPQFIQLLCLAFYYILVMGVVYVLTTIDENLQTLSKEKRLVKANYIMLNEKLLITLREMELVYANACEIKCNINAAFEAPVLVSALQCFHSIVSEAYIIYHAIVVDTHTAHLVVNCSIWILYQFLKIYSLARSGNLLKEKAMTIAQTLHNIPTDQQDTRMLLEVQHFSSMMKYQSTVATVYDYFPLDSTLMSGMIATATMYLIILVQFDKTNDKMT